MAPLGHRVTLDFTSSHWTAEVIGRGGSFREGSVWEEPQRELFTTESQTTIRGQTLVVREKAPGSLNLGSDFRRLQHRGCGTPGNRAGGWRRAGL